MTLPGALISTALFLIFFFFFFAFFFQIEISFLNNLVKLKCYIAASFICFAELTFFPHFSHIKLTFCVKFQCTSLLRQL